jgi:hypothetical protein
MDLESNWHKFNRFFSPAPARKRGVLALAHQERIIHAAITGAKEDGPRTFKDLGMPIQDLSSAYSALQDRYRVRSLGVVDRDDLLKILLDMPLTKGEVPSERLYHAQISLIRSELGIDGGRGALDSRGERPLAHFYPRFHFLLQAFRLWFADLLPERRILFVGIYDEEKIGFEALMLEYSGRKIVRVIDPDFGNFDWRSLTHGFVRKDGAERFVAWCESKYTLPTYSIFLTRAVWDECQSLHANEGARSAWKLLLRRMRGGDLSREVCIEPYAWPIRAAFYWGSLRSRD